MATSIWAGGMTRPLLEKLGYRSGMATRVENTPSELITPFKDAIEAAAEPPVWLMGFAVDQAELARLTGLLAPHYRRGGHLWLCYPKKTGHIRTDLTRDAGWAPIAALDLLGVAKVSLDDTWSALRFRYRDEIRTISRRST